VCEKEDNRREEMGTNQPNNPFGIKKEGWVVIPKLSTWSLINN